MRYDKKRYQELVKKLNDTFSQHKKFWGMNKDVESFKKEAKEVFDELWAMGIRNNYEELVLKFIDQILNYEPKKKNVDNISFIESNIKGIAGVAPKAVKERELNPDAVFECRYFKNKPELTLEEFKSIIENSYNKISEIRSLSSLGVFDDFIPEWERLRNDKTGWPHKTHSFRIDEHTFIALSYLQEKNEFLNLHATYRKIVSLAILFHDIGKQGGPKHKRPKTNDPEHPVTSARICKSRLKEMGYPDYVIDIVSKLVYYHDTLGDLVFKIDTRYKDQYIDNLIFSLKHKVYFQLLKIITEADIYAVKKNGAFLSGKIRIGDSELEKTQAISLEYSRIVTRAFPDASSDEKKFVIHMIFQDYLPFGHQRLMLYCINHWEEVFQILGFNKDRVKTIKLLVSFESFILKRGLHELNNLKLATSSNFVFVMQKLERILPLLIKYGLRDIIDLIRICGKDHFRSNGNLFTECILPRMNLFLKNEFLYKSLLEIFRLGKQESGIPPKLLTRITNITFDHFFRVQGKIIGFPPKEEILQKMIEEAEKQKKSTDVSIDSLKDSSKEVFLRSLGTKLNLNEVQAIIEGNIPLCYYHLTSFDSFKLILDNGFLSPLLLKAYNKKIQSLNPKDSLYSQKKEEIFSRIKDMKETDLKRIESKPHDFHGVRSKFFKREMKWLTFLGAPPPFNAKENFYTLLSNYATKESVVIELLPSLYQKIMWNRMLLGGILASEEQLIHQNKLTRDLVIDQPVPVSYINKIFCFNEMIPYVKELVQGLPVRIFSIDDYATAYQEEINEAYSAKEQEMTRRGP
ncbi:MAG: HD domain-containing protein [Candidatus Woesearchaeota archaeon]